MTQEDKELLLKDICSRVFYNVKVTVPIMSLVIGREPYTEPIELISVNCIDGTCTVGNEYAQTSGIRMFNRLGELICKPYLRSISSMTEEEQLIFSSKCELTTDVNGEKVWSVKVSGYDWLNKNHFDYRGLIEKGLALKAPEGMYD